ncbi:MAG: hypothetical protein MZV70_63490 [Desulfobacterales bacterium]|nr:hypothetical protein [Desulfobacterales bacterium]
MTGTDDSGAVANSGAVSQSVNVLALSRPTITKSFSNSTLYLGGVAGTLTITVTNPNAVVGIANFSVTDNFPTAGADGAIIEVANPPSATASCTGGGTPRASRRRPAPPASPPAAARWPRAAAARSLSRCRRATPTAPTR